MNHQDFYIIFASGLFVHNFALSQFLGLCPFLGISGHQKSAAGLSIATTFVLTLASGVCYLAFQYILVPFELEYLRTLVFILVIAMVVQLSELIIRAASPLLHRLLGIYLPLITSNCAVLGVALFGSQTQLASLPQALWYGFTAGLGFALALMLLNSIRIKMSFAHIPAPFKGAPIALVAAGILSMAFMGFIGMDR